MRSSTAPARRSRRPRWRQRDVSSSSGRGSPAASALGWRRPLAVSAAATLTLSALWTSALSYRPVAGVFDVQPGTVTALELEPGRAGRHALHRAIRRIQRSGEIVEARPRAAQRGGRGVTSATVRMLGLAAAGTVVTAGRWAPSLAVLTPAAAGVLGVRNRFSDLDGVVLTFDDGPHPGGTPAILAELDGRRRTRSSSSPARRSHAIPGSRGKSPPRATRSASTGSATSRDAS